MDNKQKVSREEYRRLDNRVTCILQQRWPANEISQWVRMLKGKQQSVACAILRRHPRPAQLALPTIAHDVPNPHQARANRPTVPVLTADGRQIGRGHVVEGLTPVAIDQSCTIRCAVTGRPLWVALGSSTDRANPGIAEQLNPTYQPVLHQVVADQRQHVEATIKPKVNTPQGLLV